MTSQARMERVHKYFVPDPPPPGTAYVQLAFGGVLAIMAVVFFAAGAKGACLGLPAFIGALVLLVKGASGLLRFQRAKALATPKATDAEMDAWLREADPHIIRAAYQRLNIHPTELGSNNRSPYLIFHGIPELFSVTPFHYRRARDGVMRYSAYEILVVFLSNWRLPVYECVLDLATGATIRDSTKEYALKQVDGMETVSDRINVFNDRWQPGSTPFGGSLTGGGMPGALPAHAAQVGHFTQRQAINLLVSGRVAVDLWLGIAPGETMVVQGVTPPSAVDGMISQLREHLRVHSGAVHPGVPGPVAGYPGLAPGGIDPSMLSLPGAGQPAAAPQGWPGLPMAPPPAAAPPTYPSAPPPPPGPTA
jgi:hypothetical protein